MSLKGSVSELKNILLPLARKFDNISTLITQIESAIIGEGKKDLESVANLCLEYAQTMYQNQEFFASMALSKFAFEVYQRISIRYFKEPKCFFVYKRNKIKCITHYIESYLSANWKNLVNQGFEFCEAEIRRILHIFEDRLPVPSEAIDDILWTLIRRFNQELENLQSFAPPLTLMDFFHKNLPGFCLVQIGNKYFKEVHSMRTKWLNIAEKFCPDIARMIADEMKNSDVRLQLKEILPEILRFMEEGDFAKIKDILSPLANQAQKYLLTKLENMTLKEPERTPRPFKIDIRPDIKIAMEQIKNQNFEGAEQTLSNVYQNDPANIFVLDWLGYVRGKMGKRVALENLETVQRQNRADHITLWNLAVLLKNEKLYDKALNMLKLISLPDNDVIEGILGLSLILKDYTTFYEVVIKTFEPKFYALGLTLELRKEEEKLYKSLLNDFVKIIQALTESSFYPPDNEFLTGYEIQKVAAYFIQYGLLKQGVGYFVKNYASLKWSTNRQNIRRDWRLLQKGAELCENAGEYHEGLLLLRIHCNKILKLPFPDNIKGNAVQNLLNYCLRNNLINEAQQFFEEYQDYLPSTAKQYYKSKLQKLLFPVTAPVAASAEEKSKILSTLADLKYKLSHVILPEQIAEKKEECIKYSDCIRYLYGKIGERISSTLNKMVETISLYVHEKEAQKRSLLLTQLDYLLGELNEAEEVFIRSVGKDEARELLFLKNIKRAVGQLIPLKIEPKIDILNSYLPLLGTTHLVVRIENKNKRALTNVKVNVNSIYGLYEIKWDPNTLMEINALSSRVILMPLVAKKDVQEGDSEKISVTLEYVYDDVKYQLPVQEFILKAQKFMPVQPENCYVVDVPIPVERAENFYGREKEIQELKNLLKPEALIGSPFLDGVRRVGKTSLLNFLEKELPDTIIPIRVNADEISKKDSGYFLFKVCENIRDKILKVNPDLKERIPLEKQEFEKFPKEAFSSYIEEVKKRIPEKTILIIIDEFQEIINSIKEKKEKGVGLDEDVLDAIRNQIAERKILFLMTGSIRARVFGEYLRHPIWGYVRPIGISFINYDAVRSVLQNPLVTAYGIIYTEEALKRVWELTKGYPWIVQTFGFEVIRRLNDDQRKVVTPDDIDMIAQELLKIRRYFEWWYDERYISEEAKAIITELLRLQEKPCSGVPVEKLYEKLGSKFYSHIGELIDQQVLEIVDNVVRIKAELLEKWLSTYALAKEELGLPKYVAIAIDHDNLFYGLKEKWQELTGEEHFPPQIIKEVIKRINAKASEYGRVELKLVAGRWDQFLNHMPFYNELGFNIMWPIRKHKNDTDEELISSFIEQIDSKLKPVSFIKNILVTGDHHFIDLARRLRQQGKTVLIWGWKGKFSKELKEDAKSDWAYLDDIIEFSSLFAQFKSIKEQ
jgi:uncharacterized LabA/DUF88 family protein